MPFLLRADHSQEHPGALGAALLSNQDPRSCYQGRAPATQPGDQGQGRGPWKVTERDMLRLLEHHCRHVQRPDELSVPLIQQGVSPPQHTPSSPHPQTLHGGAFSTRYVNKAVVPLQSHVRHRPQAGREAAAALAQPPEARGRGALL